MTGFHEVRFPDNIAYGATGGPEFATTVVATGSGHEKRNVNWAQARGRWDVASGLKKQAQIDELIAFFRARRGKAYGFRFKDWTDYKATGQLLGTGDDARTQFQLLKHYPSGSVIELRTITKPVAGTVKVYLDGLEQASGWSVDTTTGLVTFGGELIEGTGEVPLAEDSEAYEVDVLDPDGEVVRTVTGLTSPSWIYTAAMQAEDFPVVAVKVYQISAQVGRGFAGRFDFPDAPQLTTLGESIAEGQAGSGTSNFPANTVIAQRYTGIAGQVLSASAYLGSSASGNMRIGLYADNAGEPGVLIATTEAKAFSATSSGHWEELAFTAPPTTVGGVNYWLACHTDVSVNSRGSDGANQNDARRLIRQSYAGGLPDPFGSGSSYNNTRGMKMLVWTNPT